MKHVKRLESFFSCRFQFQAVLNDSRIWKMSQSWDMCFLPSRCRSPPRVGSITIFTIFCCGNTTPIIAYYHWFYVQKNCMFMMTPFHPSLSFPKHFDSSLNCLGFMTMNMFFKEDPWVHILSSFMCQDICLWPSFWNFSWMGGIVLSHTFLGNSSWCFIIFWHGI